MRTHWVKVAAIPLLVLLPFLLRWVYEIIPTLPPEVVIGTGPEGGQFRPLMESLGQEIRTKLGVRVTFRHTNGSLENLLLLQAGNIDFGLYQAGALDNMQRLDTATLEEIRSRLPSGTEEITFVSNLHLAPAHFIVRRGSGIQGPADLRGKRVSLGVVGAGEYAMSLVLWEHFGLTKDSIRVQNLKYSEVKQSFENGRLDAAFTAFGVQAPIYRELFENGKVALLSIPDAEALAAQYLSLSQYRIPTGLYHSQLPVSPPTDVRTVALNVQLLARAETNARLVEEVTRIILSEEFQKKSRLQELFVRGREFARERPEFAIHRGALRVYETNPLLDPELIDLQVKILSFTLSFIIAGVSGVQWLKRRRERKRAHKLEPFIKELSDIERRQILLMSHPKDDSYQHLEKLLQEVTRLRHKALSRFSPRELNEDRAVDCFLETCHDISNEIHGRLLRTLVGGNEGRLGAELQSTARRDE